MGQRDWRTGRRGRGPGRGGTCPPAGKDPRLIGGISIPRFLGSEERLGGLLSYVH